MISLKIKEAIIGQGEGYEWVRVEDGSMGVTQMHCMYWILLQYEAMGNGEAQKVIREND